MVELIDLRRLDQLLGAGAQLVEVLPRAEYDEQHLPGARSIPLKTFTSEAVAMLDATRPVVVYCWDSL
jgi:rhodanese-related sulfurtransferase